MKAPTTTTTTDAYLCALGHLNAALDAVTDCEDTLAAAVIAQAVSVVERAIATGAA